MDGMVLKSMCCLGLRLLMFKNALMIFFGSVGDFIFLSRKSALTGSFDEDSVLSEPLQT